MNAGNRAVTRIYPLGLRLSGRRVLVVGGGTLARRRVPALLAAGAEVVLVSPTVTPALQDLADTGQLDWVARGFEPGDVAGAWLVVVATDDAGANAAVSLAAEAARVFCVRSDDADAASAWTPAVARHEEVTVAVLGGGDPRRSARLRDAIAAGLADGGLDAPPVRRREPRRPGQLVPETPRPVPGVVLIGAGPGDPELITVRGRRLLGRADVVVADRLAPQLLLDTLAPDVELVDAAKIPHGRQLDQDAINELIVDRALAGRYVVRLKGGDPMVFGRGGEEAAACLAAGVPVEVVPGVTSAIAVPGLAGIPVTQRGVAHELVIVSGHLPPDHPDSLVDWSALGALRGTLVVLMAVRNLPAITAALLDRGRPADTPAAVVSEGAGPRQRTVTGSLTDIARLSARAAISAPAVVIIGRAVTTLTANAKNA